MGRQLCAVLRYSIRGGQAGLEVLASRFVVCYVYNLLNNTHIYIFYILIIDIIL